MALDFHLRLLPSVDIRSATSVLALGPLTALRTFIMIAGTIYGIAPSKLMATKLLGSFVLALMLGTQWLLDRMHERIQQRELQVLVPDNIEQRQSAEPYSSVRWISS